jgi:3-methyladenine DNA glycosylase AlkD
VAAESRAVTTPATARAFFRKRFTLVGIPARAKQEQAYLKSNLRFYGASVPEIRRAGADFARAHPDLTRRELRAIVDALYASKWHEYRSVAIALLGRYAGQLRETDLPWLAGLVRSSNTWAHVDWLAADIIGGVVQRYPPALKRLSGWARDRNLWVRRTALLAQIRVVSHGAVDFELFAKLAVDMLDEREFFIRKAIGWVLREASKSHPDLVYGFLRDHRGRISSLSLREGAKYLPAAMRTKLGLAAGAGRPVRRHGQRLTKATKLLLSASIIRRRGQSQARGSIAGSPTSGASAGSTPAKSGSSETSTWRARSR